jgi:hypothetical protein
LGTRTFRGCPKCRHSLHPIDLATVATHEPPRVADLLKRPFRWEALITATAIAVPVWLAGYIPFAGGIVSSVGFAAAVAYYFQVVDHVGRKRDGMPDPSGVEDWGDVRRLSQRGLLCMLVGFAPFLIWRFTSDDTAMSTGLLWLVVGQLYMPAALLTVVITGSTAGALWPVAWAQIITRAPLQYLLLVGLYLVSIVVGFFANGFLRSELSIIPVAGTLIALTLERVLWFTQAALVGGFLAANAEKLGWD